MTEAPMDPSRRRCLAQLGGVLTLTALGPGFALTGCDDGLAVVTTTTNPAANGPFDVNFRLTARA